MGYLNVKNFFVKKNVLWYKKALKEALFIKK